jgi:hypothetical protein
MVKNQDKIKLATSDMDYEGLNPSWRRGFWLVLHRKRT